MVEIPSDVDKWSLGTITDLLNEGYDESLTLEYKSEFNDKTEKIPKTACAFANTEGGFLIFVVDNNSEKNSLIVERIVGIEDADDIHKKIVDRIKQIESQIPMGNIIFRKSNIKLDNKKVIVVLKIEKSKLSPHQYDYVFYKRLPGNNERMNAEEVKAQILYSQKRLHHVVLLLMELGLIKSTILEAKKNIDKNDLQRAMGNLNYFALTSSIYFLHEQSYLYSIEVPNALAIIIHNVRRLGDLPIMFKIIADEQITESIKDTVKKEGYSDPKEYVKTALATRINEVLKQMENLEEKFQRKIKDTHTMILEPEK